MGKHLMWKKLLLTVILITFLILSLQPVHAQEPPCVVDLVLALDGDSTVRSWAVDLLNGLPVGDDQLQVAVQVAGEPATWIEPSEDITVLAESINAAEQTAEADLYDILKSSFAETSATRTDVPNVLLVVTDGYIKGTEAQDLAATVRPEMAILIVAIGNLKVNELV